MAWSSGHPAELPRSLWNSTPSMRLVRPTLEFPNYAYVDEDTVSYDDYSYYRYLDFVLEMSSAGEASENWGSMFGLRKGRFDRTYCSLYSSCRQPARTAQEASRAQAGGISR
ncbi:hypothetical protein L5D93_12575 [Paenibacillus thiaminolyticus]|nr:hypothetical protein [Paenibacillus thiaminolyticus]